MEPVYSETTLTSRTCECVFCLLYISSLACKHTRLHARTHARTHYGPDGVIMRSSHDYLTSGSYVYNDVLLVFGFFCHMVIFAKPNLKRKFYTNTFVCTTLVPHPRVWLRLNPTVIYAFA